MQEKYEEAVNKVSSIEKQFKVNSYKILMAERAQGGTSTRSIEANGQDSE